MRYRLRSKKGMTLIEVLLAVLICAIVIIGGSLLFIRGKSIISLQEQHRLALHLTVQKVEELKTTDYFEIPTGSTQADFDFEEHTYTRTMVVDDMGSYKKIKVSVVWNQMGSECEVSLDTFKARQ